MHYKNFSSFTGVLIQDFSVITMQEVPKNIDICESFLIDIL